MILASGSPRRKELLKELIPDFQILTSEKDEIFEDNKNIYENIMDIAYEKCNDVRLKNNITNDIIIGGDTIVYLDNKILLKPKNYDDAFEMIKSYNNKKQAVITGMCLMKASNNILNIIKFYDVSYVTFKDITDEQIHKWLSFNRYMDKSGSYAIQETKDNIFNVEIEGSINNIVGLPTEKLKIYLNSIKEN